MEDALGFHSDEREVDVLLRVVVVEGKHDGREAPVQREGVGQRPVLAHGVNRRVAGSQPGGPARHAAAPGEDDDGLGTELVGHDNGALDELLARVGQLGALVIAGVTAALDAAGDAVEDLDALHRVFAHGGLAGEHDGVGLLEDRVGHVRDLGAGGHGILDHALEHVRGDDDGLADAEAEFDGLALDDGQLLVRALDAEVAARDHDAVGFADNFLEVLHRLLVFDLGDDLRAVLGTFGERAELAEILRLAHEGEREVVHAEFEAEGHVGDVLRGEGGEADLDAGKVDVAAAAELAGREDFALDLVAVLGEHLHLNLAVVEQHHVAHADIADEVLVVHLHGVLLLALLAAHGEGELLPWFEVERHFEIAGADGRSLRVHEDADGALAGLGGGTEMLHGRAHPIVRRVRHVKPGDVHAGVHELADDFRRTCGGTKRGDNFGASHRIGGETRGWRWPA